MSSEDVVQAFTEAVRVDPVLSIALRAPELKAQRDCVWLNDLRVYTEFQHAGHAGRALRLLTRLCDAAELSIRLVALPLRDDPRCAAAMGLKTLREWYEREGFERADGGTMLRSPNKCV